MSTNFPPETELNKMLDFVKKEVFLGKNAAFLGSLLCSLEFKWDYSKPDTVYTNGVLIGWGPKDFLECSHEERVSTLLHEIWHVARMHMVRRGSRDPVLWNIAGDYRINNDLRADGYHIPNTWVVDPSIDVNGLMAEEDIYELLLKSAIPLPQEMPSDLQDGVNQDEQQNIVAAVVRATQAAELAKSAGGIPGGIKEFLETFLTPVVPWRNVLMQWMTDLQGSDYTWRKRNRRYRDIYMPSVDMIEDGLEHLVYFQDTSGSISQDDMIRFNSELKYIQEVLNPSKLTIVQFDTQIQYVKEFERDEPFEGLEIHGGGGTWLKPVREWIQKHRPTAAIVFSDLWCDPMGPVDIPVIWAVVNNPSASVPYGTKIVIND